MKDTWLTKTDASGKPRPAVCVPVVASAREEIWAQAERIGTLPADMAEWRADCCREEDCTENIALLLEGLKKRLCGKALLFTCRTKAEGGGYAGSLEEYLALCRKACRSGYVDALDLEVFQVKEHASSAIRYAHEHGCRVIASSHDFANTPPSDEMLRRLRYMEELGADAAKLAVMPSCPQDVLNLMQITLTADQELRIPVITMSMGKTGTLSRISGRLTGSAVTFASAGRASAPGQIGVEEMAEILKIL